jgi:hypothetical protein
MASLADLINLDLSDTTDKIIVEYLWLASSSAFHLLPILTEKERSCQRYRITLSREITLLTFYINDL